jgi:hypothetical protein
MEFKDGKGNNSTRMDQNTVNGHQLFCRGFEEIPKPIILLLFIRVVILTITDAKAEVNH